MVSWLESFFIGCLCIRASAAAILDCNENDFSVITLNVTAVQISSYLNSSYSINLNTTLPYQYFLGPDSEINITGLCPEIYYSFNLSNSESFCILVHKINGTINQLNIKRVNATAAYISWKKIPGGSYSVIYGNSTYDLFGEINIEDVQDYSVNATVNPLCPTVLYQFNVTLTVEDEQCLQFFIKTSYINNEDVTAGIVSNLSESSIVNETAPVESSYRLSVRVDWDTPDIVNCPITKYKVTFDQVDYNVSKTNVDILGLLPNTMYTIVIVPVSIAGEGASLMKNITTTTDIPWDSPSNFQIHPMGTTAVKFTWSPPNIPGAPLTDIKYIIIVTREDGTNSTSVYQHPTLLRNFSNLKRYERICATITALNDIGQGPSSSTCGHTAESKSDPVRNLEYSVLSEHSIALSWDEPLSPYGIITHYKVSVYQSGHLMQQSNHTENVIRISNLDLGVKYSLEVRAVNGAGDGGGSIISTYANNDKITLLSSLTATKISNTSFQVAWREPSEINSVVFRYELEYCPRGIFANTSKTMLTIQSNQRSHTIIGVDLFTSYIVKLTAVSNHGQQSSEIIYSATTQTTVSEESVLQLHIYGNIDCKDNNQTVIALLMEAISKQVDNYCNCGFNISPEANARLLCHRNANISIIRIEITQDGIGYASTWLKSSNPIVFVSGRVLLIDTLEMCSYFVSDINNEDCIFRYDSRVTESCDGPIIGAFFGTLIPCCLIISLIWLIIVLLCWRSHTTTVSNSELNSTNINSKEGGKNPRRFFRTNRKSTHTYENVIGFKGKDKLKLNTLPVEEGTTTVVPSMVVPTHDESDDTYSNEVDIKELRENIKLQSSTTSLKTPTSGEYMNVRRKVPSKSSVEKTPANVKAAAPQVKPKPKGGSTGNISMQSNTAYKQSTRDECNKIIQAFQHQ